MSASDILKVLYAPHKVFKEIIQNPKYWGPLLVLILVVATQSGYYYAQSQKIYYEQTSPGSDQLGAWTTNATIWTISSGATVTNNYSNYLNSSYYGNGTLQFSITNSSQLFMAIPSFSGVDCSTTAFQNFSLRVEQASPSEAPSQVKLTLYSQSDSSTYQTDLTSQFSNTSLVGSWINITVPVGAKAAGWQTTGNPQWTNITGLKLDFSFTSSSNTTLRLTGMFFRGEYKTFEQISTSGLAITILQQVLFSFVFEWLFLTGLTYVIIKGLKGTVTWKPLFVAFGLVLIIVAIQAVVNVAATQALPIIHSPIELQVGLPVEADAINAAIASMTATYTLITGVVQLAVYIWIVALGVFVVRAVQPEFTTAKCVLTSAAALIVTIILMTLLGV